MAFQSRHEFRLEIERGSDPIAGSLSAQDGAGLAFAGWLGLASALERMLNVNRPVADGDGSPTEEQSHDPHH